MCHIVPRHIQSATGDEPSEGEDGYLSPEDVDARYERFMEECVTPRCTCDEDR